MKKVSVLQLRCTPEDRIRFHSLAKYHNTTLSKLIIKLLNEAIDTDIVIFNSKVLK